MVQFDEFLALARRAGWPFFLLLVVLILSIPLRHYVVPRPNLSRVITGVGIWLMGAIAVGFSLLAASTAESQSKIQRTAASVSEGLHLVDQDIENIRYDGKSLRSSRLQDAVLTGVGFSGADLSESDLRGATFRDVDFSGARLCAVDARGANFEGALNLPDVSDMRFLVYDEATKFPDDFLIHMSEGPIAVGPKTRQSFMFTCDGVVNRVLQLGDTE